MKNLSLVFSILILVSACSNNDNIPDVSKIKVEVPVERFDKDFFKLDTTRISEGLKELKDRHPDFYPEFMKEILGVSGADTNVATIEVSKLFLRSYSSFYHDLEKKYNDVEWLQKDLQQAFRFVKYYFPDYKVGKAILFVGTLDAPGMALTKTGIAIGLHQFAGKDYPVYQSMEAQQLFPIYISRRFESRYITANCMKAVIEDIYPDRSGSKGFIEQMIEKGKQWWVLDKFLPKTPDSIKTGFTKQQLSWCKENEGLIWNDIITTEKDLYTRDPRTIQNYIGEAPYTQSLGPASPGNIGQWIGWQIVKKFAGKNSSMPVTDILKTDARKIFEGAKYKPK